MHYFGFANTHILVLIQLAWLYADSGSFVPLDKVFDDFKRSYRGIKLKMCSQGWIKQLSVLWPTKHLQKGMMDQTRELSPQLYFKLSQSVNQCNRSTLTSYFSILRRAHRPCGLIFVLHRKNNVHPEAIKGDPKTQCE